MAELTNLSVSQLRAGYVSREFSPVDVTEAYLDRIDDIDGQLHSFITVTPDLARSQAETAERTFLARESAATLTGIPVAIKDAFHVAGVRSTLGSVLYRDHMAKLDSGVTRRLRQAGAVFTGKTNTAEFGQSATCENMLGADTANPWDLAATPGGSSGGSASAMAARLSALAVGSDGGGSIRIPAAFCGIYGLKTTPGLCPDEKGFRGMTDFVGAGPMASSVADARILLGVMAEKQYARKNSGRLRIAYCPRPENLPVDTEVLRLVRAVASILESMGHEVVETDLPLEGWNEIFGPLVLDDEHRERGHLLDPHAEKLTRYERSSLRAARALEPSLVDRARLLLPRYRNRMSAFLAEYDIVLTPTTAIPAFDRNARPSQIDGQDIDRLWGPFPFAVPFNVAGVCAASVPCGMVDGKPVGAQLVAAAGAEQRVLDLSEDLEDAVNFDYLAAAARFEKASVKSS